MKTASFVGPHNLQAEKREKNLKNICEKHARRAGEKGDGTRRGRERGQKERV